MQEIFLEVTAYSSLRHPHPNMVIKRYWKRAAERMLTRGATSVERRFNTDAVLSIKVAYCSSVCHHIPMQSAAFHLCFTLTTITLLSSFLYMKSISVFTVKVSSVSDAKNQRELSIPSTNIQLTINC